MKLGIIGCGSIGTALVEFAAAEPRIASILLFDVVAARATQLAKHSPKCRVATTGPALVDEADLVVEAASQEAAREFLPLSIERGRSVLCMSMGALVDDAWREGLLRRAQATGARLYLPSGAVCGIDGLKAGALGGLKSVTLVTTKPPASLGLKVDKWTLVFDGNAREAVQKFPQNINVAACLSLAGIGFDQTRVQIAADPLATRNQHKVIIEGAFGRARIEVENLPSPSNPKTSYLASLSAIATLKRLLEPLQLGA